mgnify:CR=1 FL=1
MRQGNNKVQVIDLVLQSEMVKWGINGHNSMVKMNDNFMCLRILDSADELDTLVLGMCFTQEQNKNYSFALLILHFLHFQFVFVTRKK